MVNTWNSDCITPLEETDSTKVLDAQQQLQKTLSAGSNILIENGQISASGTLSNVQADWTQNDSAEPDYIKNKPQNLVQDATYVHTDNNFSDSDKEKLNGIAAGAEVNVQSDWNVSDSDSDAFIKNKPTIPIVDQIYNGNSTNAQAGVAVSSAISTAVGGIRQVPSTQSTDNGKVLGVTDDQGTVGWVQPTAEQVQSDWNQSNSSSPDYIKNKPTIPSFDQTQMAAINSGVDATKVSTYDAHVIDGVIHVTSNEKTAWDNKQDAISDLQSIRTGASKGATAVQPSSLATVATTGDYADLQNKPSIPAAQVNSDWNSSSGVSQILNKPTLATVATTGDYNDLSNKPSIPAAQVQSDWNQSDSAAVDYIKNKPNIPAGVVVDEHYGASSSNAQAGTAVAEAIATVRQVPSTQSTDNGKVLGVTDNQGSLGWVNQPVIGTVNV